MDLQILTPEDVLRIHETLVAEFAASSDPIYPPGVKSIALLQSAVGRQTTGLGPVLKYPTPIENAATLLYGVCNDHPFHNGNKRTALVAMLVHLDKNKLTLFNTTQRELYDLMLKVASHRVSGQPAPRAKSQRKSASDDEVERIARWLSDRADRIRRGERIITYRELRTILERFNYYLVNPDRNHIDIVKYVHEEKGFLKRRTVIVPKHIGTIPWPGENKEMQDAGIKQARAICQLREQDGVDSDSFYNDTAIIDSYVNRYRSVLRRLAKV